MTPPVIDDDAALRQLAAEFRDMAELALDIEGDGLFRYRSRLCTVQLATPAETVVVDTLAAKDRTALAGLLGAMGPRKIVHDVSYDARLLAENGVVLGNVFDTALAARYLGEPSTGLAALVAKRFGVELPKEQQQADWGVRPFTEEALAYLASDVRHLLALGEALEADVRAAGIEEEVREENAYLLERALEDPPEPKPPWTRVKGREELSDAGLAVLREVAAVREEAARTWDVPPFKVTGNQQLLEMARRRPKSAGELGRIRGLGRGRVQRLTGRFLDAVRRGEAAGAVPEAEREQRPKPPPGERETRKKRQQALTAWRRAEAESRGVDTQVVLPGHCLNDLATRGAASIEDLRAIPGLGECRITRYAPSLLEHAS
jgi:ribonuclease D